MALEQTERMYLERQIALARAVIAALSLIAMVETAGAPVGRVPFALLLAYLLVALGAALGQRFYDQRLFRIPLTADLAMLAAFLYVTPSVSVFWFLFLFTVFALSTRGNMRAMLALVGVATVAVTIRMGAGDSFRWQSASGWAAAGIGTLVSGLGMGFLGAREQQHLSRQQFLDKITSVLRYDTGLTESIRQALVELTKEFECEHACLAMRDDEIERVFTWKVNPNDQTLAGPETLPLGRSEMFLLDCLEASIGWERKNGRSEAFGWDRRTSQRIRSVPDVPASTISEFGAHSLLAASIESEGRPAGRVLLFNAKKARGFSEADLRWLEQIVRHLGPPLENVFVLRNLRMRAVEAERSRISRDLHDGILQTLLSLKIQLGVLRGKLPQSPDGARDDLASLQTTVEQESTELRRMVTDLRPLRVESADLRELMFAFAERFRREHGLAIDLFVDERPLRAPDRICRELFQIYRESLHNVKKHAGASHVVVKLQQDETRVFLIVDDNGLGFSFSGRYASEELDRLRLGPISIKERTRSVGGSLTVESNPGHGARLTVEIPVD